MKKINYTNLEDITEFLKILGYKWTGVIADKNLFRFATIDDFKDVVTLKLQKDDKIECLHADISDFNFYIEEKGLQQKFDFANHSTLWQAFMIYRKNETYSKLLYRKTLAEKREVEKSYNQKINLTQKLLDRYQYEKSLEIAQFNTTLLNITTNLKKSATEATAQNNTNEI